MGIEQLITWYQKKLGTYDKQLWEKTIEQRILRSLANIQFKNAVRKKSVCNADYFEGDYVQDIRQKDARLKTEFIDIDLVRGSSFTKTKPKHGLVTVVKLATLRYFFLPLYCSWWMQQTSYKIFSVLLLVYLGQLLNIAIYSYYICRLTDDTSERIPCSEIVVPVVMGWILSLIHSQIVSTQSDRNGPVAGRTQHRRNFRKRRKGKVSPVAKNYTNAGTASKDNVDLKRNVCGKENIVIFPKCVIFEPVDEPIRAAGGSKNLRQKGQDVLLQPSNDDGFESFNGNCSSPDSNEEYEVAMSTACSLNNLNATLNNCEESDISRGTSYSNEDIDRKIDIDNNHLKPGINLYSRKLKSNSGKLKVDVGFTNDSIRQVNRRAWKNHSSPTHEESTSCDSEDGETVSSPDIGENFIPTLTEGTTSATEWMGVTTNTEDCSYSSELEPSDNENLLWDTPFNPSAILSPYAVSDRVSCTVWKRNEIKKAELSVFDISCEIIAKVEEVPETTDYFYVGVCYASILALLPALCRLSNAAIDSATSGEVQLTVVEISELVFEKFSGSTIAILDAAFGQSFWERVVTVGSLVQRLIFACFFICLLSVAERTFKQRFLYAKLFSHLTSSRRARKSLLPHFRLNKVRNIKSWLSIRSFLKKRGPQRSVDVIVSSAFVITLLLLSFLSMELLKDCGALNSQYNIEALFWCLGLGCILLRFMTLGTKINQKYRSNLSILITEQINLYLQIEQKPHKKEELNVANSVLKLAADLLKELETPFKISGLSTNPHIYTITKVFVLSALSGVLSEMLGFKLKLHKIKIK